jgi:hypothetical protein
VWSDIALVQYITEFGMDEPFESMRKEMFQILNDVTTTSELYDF